MSAVKSLLLTDMCNVTHDTDNNATATSKPSGGSHLLGRIGGVTRLERYTFKPTEQVTIIDFEFSAVYNNSAKVYSNFTYSQGTDLRQNGVKVYISEKEDMSDWDQGRNGAFSPTKYDTQRGGILSFESSFTKLRGRVILETPLDEDKTYYIFFYASNSNSSNWGGFWWTSNSSIPPTNASTYISKRKPSQPKNLQVFLLKNGLGSNRKVEFQWEEEEDVLNNVVTKYWIEAFKNNSEIPFFSETRLRPEANDGETVKYFGEITNSSQASYSQGDLITLKIRSEGEENEEDYKYSDWIETIFTINTIPNKPTITAKNNKVFENNSTQAVFTIDYDDIDLDGDVVLCYYITKKGESATSPKKIENKVFFLNPAEYDQIDFYCSDSFEDSEVVSISTGMYTVAIEHEYNTPLGGDNDNVITGIGLSFSKKDGYSEATLAKYVRVLLQLKNDDGSRAQNIVFSTEKTANIDLLEQRLKIFPQATQWTLSIFPLQEDKTNFLDSEGNSICILEASDFINFPIIPNKDDINVYDQLEETNIHNESSYSCFFSTLMFSVPAFDPQIYTYGGYVNFGAERYKITQMYSYPQGSGSKPEKYYFSASIPAKEATKKETIKLTLYRGLGLSYEFDLGEYTQIGKFLFQDLKLGAWSTEVSASEQKSFAISFTLSDELCKWYALDKNDLAKTTALVIEDAEVEKKYVSTEFKTGQSVFIITLVNTQEVLSKYIHSTDCYGMKTLKCKVRLKNKYNNQSESSQVNLNANLNRTPSIDNFIVQLKIDESYIGIDEERFKMLEGMNIKIDSNITQWTYEDVDIKLCAKTYNTDKKVVLWETRKSAEEENVSFVGTTKDLEMSFTVPEITSGEQWNLFIELKPSKTNATEIEIGTFSILSIKNPELLLQSIDYDNGNYDISYFFGEDNTEIRDGISTKLVWQSGSVEIESNPVFFESDDPLLSKESLAMWIEIREVFSNSNYELTKLRSSNKVLVYNIVPTIAYRKNRLLINSKTGNEDSVLYINRASEAHLVRLKIQSSEGQELGDLTIDLYNGSVNNALVDCGSWDNTPGGIIPTPELPIGLAAIAYSGDIADLQQNKNITIVLSGGSAPTEEI